jgi:hypothetical protein
MGWDMHLVTKSTNIHATSHWMPPMLNVQQTYDLNDRLLYKYELNNIFLHRKREIY